MNNYPTVSWPRGLGWFYAAITKHAPKILAGTLVSIDPSSGSKDSMPAYAVYRGGVLQAAEAIRLPLSLTVEGRLRVLHDRLAELQQQWQPDVLVCEQQHRNMGHLFLLYSVGTVLSAVRPPVTIMVPIPVWKSLAKVDPTYTKGDRADAIIIGRAVIEVARSKV